MCSDVLVDLVPGITFTPRETGEHLVDVKRNGKHIANSPFKIMVGESELGNASKVKVYGKGLTEGMANEVNEFIVDTREAGEWHIGIFVRLVFNEKDFHSHICVSLYVWILATV